MHFFFINNEKKLKKKKKRKTNKKKLLSLEFWVLVKKLYIKVLSKRISVLTLAVVLCDEASVSYGKYHHPLSPFSSWSSGSCEKCFVFQPFV